MAETIPSDTHAAGDTGHVTDHDNIADVLTRLAITLAQASSPGATFPFSAAGGVSALAALDTMTTGFWSGATDLLNVKAAPYRAAGNGVTDDTTAITAAINDLNAGKGGGLFFPYGNYIITSPLPVITLAGCMVAGQGWTQTSGTAGSALSAGTGTWSAPMLTLGAEGITATGICVTGSNKASTLIQVSAANCKIIDCATHSVTSAGINVNVVAGGASVWIDNCRIDGINGANIGIQINDTDAILTNNKPVNCGIGFNLLSGSSGALLLGNHATPGSGSGQNTVWIQGAGRISITGNRFDNTQRASVQITPTGTGTNSISITGNVFYNSTQPDNTYPLVSVDTSSAGVHSLVLSANVGYSVSTNRPASFLDVLTQAGAAATNPGNLASAGSLVTGNVCWAATAFYGASATPTMSRGNLVTLNGTTYTAVTDI